MSSREFTEWIAYFQIEPHGYHLDNWRFGMMTSNIVNAVCSTIPRKPGTKAKHYKPDDFYPMQKADGLTEAQRAHIERKKLKRKRKNG